MFLIDVKIQYMLGGCESFADVAVLNIRCDAFLKITLCFMLLWLMKHCSVHFLLSVPACYFARQLNGRHVARQCPTENGAGTTTWIVGSNYFGQVSIQSFQTSCVFYLTRTDKSSICNTDIQSSL